MTMANQHQLKATDCPLLQGDAESADPLGLRLVQRLLELSVVQTSTAGLAEVLLDEIGSVLHADRAAVLEATPAWKPRWQFIRRGLRPPGDHWPQALLAEVLDQEIGISQSSGPGAPAYCAACLSYVERANRVLLVERPREPFTADDLAYTVAAGHYLGMGLERARAWDDERRQSERLQALVGIVRQLVEKRETEAVLEHIARQSAELLHSERASIFLWDQGRHELVGRPALGVPDLRIPDDKGVVGKVVQTGQVEVENRVQASPSWNPQVDVQSGFRTRSLMCVPLADSAGSRLGALEVLNRIEGDYTDQDVDLLQVLAALTTSVLQSVREREALLRSNAQLQGEARLASHIVGESTALQSLRTTVERVARTDLPVLILGESGTGKEVVARAIHYSSPRQKQPFVPVNCAAMVETLLESELFGHEKGAFTGADSTRQGKFELATGGTLFLDEIGELSANGQAKLLRVLEEKCIQRVGGSQPIPVDARILAATNRNLGEMVRAGKFREDLFYRLTVVTLELPPLRDRREDILVLAEHFLNQFCGSANRRKLKLTAEARKRLEQHNWPGNVRELRNLMERVAFLSSGDKIEAADLTFIHRPASKDASAYDDLGLADATDAFQRDLISRTIKRARDNMSDAAKLLGMHRSNLYRKMKMLGMEIPK